VPALKIDEIVEPAESMEPSAQIRERVMAARNVQRKRLEFCGLFENAQMTVRQIKSFCIPTKEGKDMLKQAIRKLGLSARAHDRILRVARTIADLEKAVDIHSHHIAEAIAYRMLDRNVCLEEIPLGS
jgi:magnesium chelatase family protein